MYRVPVGKASALSGSAGTREGACQLRGWAEELLSAVPGSVKLYAIVWCVAAADALVPYVGL
jgi:hypothetical protein